MKRYKLLLTIWWLKITRRLKTSGHLLTIKKGGSGVKNALIIIPEGHENSRTARYFLKSLYKNDKADLHFLMENRLYHTYNNIFKDNVKTYSVHSEINWFQLPRKELLKRALSKRFDAVVDMHPEFKLPTAYLTYFSNAPLRVGFSSEFSEYFFNIIIDKKQSDFIEKGYQKIQKLLGI